MQAVQRSGAFCSALLGGTFNPAHSGHTAIGRYIAILLAPDELRILPTGNPWQKGPLTTSAQHRMAMARLAFAGLPVPVVVDPRETERDGPTYTVDTLKELRQEFGPAASLILVVGADQLHRLDTWRDWTALFELAHLCAVSRPGFSTAFSGMPGAVRREFIRRAATAEQLRQTPAGLCLVANGPAIDVSSTALRDALKHRQAESRLLPPAVLDYIQQHQLYQD